MQPEGNKNTRCRWLEESESTYVACHGYWITSGHGFWIVPGRESSLAQLKPVLDRFGWRWGEGYR
jgi:hypothetical protein